MSPPDDITAVLHQLAGGDAEAMERLVPLVYERLRALAHAQLRAERAGALQTTELVHDAYLKLSQQDRVAWADRRHFFAVASLMMRRILVNEAVARKRQKRGDGEVPLSIETLPELGHPEGVLDVIALDQALDRLDTVSPRARRVAECRVFVGLTVEETAAALGVAPMTVKRDWTTAQAWLLRELGGSRG